MSLLARLVSLSVYYERNGLLRDREVHCPIYTRYLYLLYVATYQKQRGTVLAIYLQSSQIHNKGRKKITLLWRTSVGDR